MIPSTGLGFVHWWHEALRLLPRLAPAAHLVLRVRRYTAGLRSAHRFSAGFPHRSEVVIIEPFLSQVPPRALRPFLRPQRRELFSLLKFHIVMT